MDYEEKSGNKAINIKLKNIIMERTGIGKIVMSFLTEPSYDYDKNGVYICKLAFQVGSKDDNDLKALIDKEMNFYLSIAKQNKDIKDIVSLAPAPYKLELSKEDNTVTGRRIYIFKRKAYKLSRYGRVIPIQYHLFNTQGDTLNLKDVYLWRDSEISIAFKPKPFYIEETNKVGITLQIMGIQVHKDVGGSNVHNAEDFGFTVINKIQVENEKIY